MKGAWPGLVTNASPYAIPAGAAVEQTNLSSHVPGQLTSRGGMRAVAFSNSSTEVLDCYPYVFGGSVRLLALTPSGDVVALSTPTPGTSLTSPLDPSLSPSAGQAQSSYTGAFYDYDGEPP